MVVTVKELKAHLRIQYDEEDEYLISLIKQAQAAAEDYCNVRFRRCSPYVVRLAVLLMCSYYYENREISDKHTYLAMRMAFENLLYPHRDFSNTF